MVTLIWFLSILVLRKWFQISVCRTSQTPKFTNLAYSNIRFNPKHKIRDNFKNISDILIYTFSAAARWVEVDIMSKSFVNICMCMSYVCANQLYQNPSQTVRLTRVVSRMARRVWIVIRRVIRIPTIPRMVTILRTLNICCQDLLSYLKYCRGDNGGQIKFV